MNKKCYSSKQLSDLLNVTEEEFHRIIKRQIKADFRTELANLGILNPDILLDTDNIITLADPRNHNNFFETVVNIFEYI